MARRLAVVCVLVATLLGVGLHHHDADAPGAPCAVCHFVVSLLPQAAAAVVMLVVPPVLAWALWQPPTSNRAFLRSASCGLRAPPALL